MKVFIPITDEMIEKGLIPGELVPYHPGQTLLCGDRQPETEIQSSKSVSSEPGPTPNRSAKPALSSRTYIAGPLLG